MLQFSQNLQLQFYPLQSFIYFLKTQTMVAVLISFWKQFHKTLPRKFMLLCSYRIVLAWGKANKFLIASYTDSSLIRGKKVLYDGWITLCYTLIYLKHKFCKILLRIWHSFDLCNNSSKGDE